MSDVFSERLKILRNGRSKAEFARILDIPAPMYHRYEAGQVPKENNLRVIAERCGVTIDWLLGRDNSNPQCIADLPKSPSQTQPVSSFADGSADINVPFDLPGAGETVLVKGLRYGSAPPYHDVPYVPGWNLNMGSMSDDELMGNVRDGVERIEKKRRGPDRAHACHYLMDFLNELANRKEKEGGGDESAHTREGD